MEILKKLTRCLAIILCMTILMCCVLAPAHAAKANAQASVSNGKVLDAFFEKIGFNDYMDEKFEEHGMHDDESGKDHVLGMFGLTLIYLPIYLITLPFRGIITAN